MKPPRYHRQKDFAADYGDETDHNSLNAEFDRVASSINPLRENLALLQLDDGSLRDGIVEEKSLTPAFRDDLVKYLSGEIKANVQEAVAATHEATDAAATAREAEDVAEKARTRAEAAAQLAISNATIILSKVQAALDAKEAAEHLKVQAQEAQNAAKFSEMLAKAAQAQVQICKDQAEKSQAQAALHEKQSIRTASATGRSAKEAAQSAEAAQKAASRIQKLIREATRLGTPADGSVTTEILAPDLALTGKPTAPTPDAQDESTRIATTAFTKATIKTAFKGPAWQRLDEIGYQKLPGGLLIQWGVAPVYNAQETCLAFPMKFSKHCLSTTTQSINVGEKPQIESIEQIYSVSNLKVKLNVPDKNKEDKLEYQIQWFAIGY